MENREKEKEEEGQHGKKKWRQEKASKFYAHESKVYVLIKILLRNGVKLMQIYAKQNLL